MYFPRTVHNLSLMFQLYQVFKYYLNNTFYKNSLCYSTTFFRFFMILSQSMKKSHHTLLPCYNHDIPKCYIKFHKILKSVYIVILPNSTINLAIILYVHLQTCSFKNHALFYQHFLWSSIKNLSIILKFLISSIHDLYLTFLGYSCLFDIVLHIISSYCVIDQIY